MTGNALRVWREVPFAGIVTRNLSSTPTSSRNKPNRNLFPNIKEKVPRLESRKSSSENPKSDTLSVHECSPDVSSRPPWPLPLSVLETPSLKKSPYKKLLQFFQTPGSKFIYSGEKTSNDFQIRQFGYEKHLCSIHRATIDLRSLQERITSEGAPKLKVLLFLIAYHRKSLIALRSVTPIRRQAAAQLDIAALLKLTERLWPVTRWEKVSTSIKFLKGTALGVDKAASKLIGTRQRFSMLPGNQRYVEYMGKLSILHYKDSNNKSFSTVINNLRHIRRGAKVGRGMRTLRYVR